MPESYTHLFAKRLLADWLRKCSYSVRMDTDDDYRLIALEPIRALVPATDILCGVYEEYPICLTTGGPTTLHKPWIDGKIPTYEELIAQNQPPAYILDIAVLNMGQVKYGIEVVHRHEVPGTKIAGLQIATHDIPFELYRVSAEWILNHCRPPFSLTMQRLIPGPRRPLPFASIEKIFQPS
jgi:hypothetical protein